ncbi:MAG: GrpB family protein [Nannocystaceae bacterium]|nr:GrpB family protein [Nannocystaceae bacterium]
MKHELARRYPSDVNAYCEAKTDFVEGILARAMA